MNSHLIGEANLEKDYIVERFIIQSLAKVFVLRIREFSTLWMANIDGYWNVGGHFFVNKENSETVTATLKIIRTFSPRRSPRYMLLDQSSIAAAFPGLSADEQE